MPSESGRDSPQQWTQERFERDILKKHAVVLVTFYADWCAPSGLQTTIIDQLAKKEFRKSCIIRFSVDLEEPLAKHWSIHTIPSTLLFLNGELVEALAGFQAIEFLEEYLQALIQEADKAPPPVEKPGETTPTSPGSSE